MRNMILPLAAVALLTMCGPRGNSGDTGSARDTTSGGAAIGSTGGSTSTAATGTGTAAGRLDDAGVVARIDLINSTEIQENSAGLKKASSPAVKAFARTMVAQHTDNRQKGRVLATTMGIKPAAGQMSEAAEEKSGDAAKAEDNLAGKTGADFDKAFIDAQVAGHQKVLDELQTTLLPAAQNADLRALIEKTIPTVQKHLDQAKQLQQRMAGSSGNS